ncbi:MAG: NADH dehydrogenase [Flavobacteriaceae bacterium]|jgi:NADH dehydrogenase
MKKRIVIIGAGFGGLALANCLKSKDLEVVLIDMNNFHNFQPLLYQVATGGLEPDSIAYPIRRIFRNADHVKFRLAEVESIDNANTILHTSIGEIAYDYLVIASGSTNNFFNFEPIKNSFFTLKTVTDALDLRSFIMQKLEKAISEIKDTQEELINMVIVGGGPAGIELAGAIAEMKKYVLPKDFPEINIDNVHVHLFEASPKLLSAMSEESSKASLQFLQSLGVEVQLNAKVVKYENDIIYLEGDEHYKTDLVIWAAGVKGNPIKGLSEQIVSGNRIAVNEFNQVMDASNIFAIGDVAAYINEKSPRGLPMLAQVAIQQGKHLAKNIVLHSEGQDLKPFVYNNKGTMATIGRDKAVVDLPKWKFQGRFAWFVWMFIHLVSLVGFRNKLVILINWAQSYFNYDRPLGLIIRRYTRK